MLILGVVDDILSVGRIIVNGGVVAACEVIGSQEAVSEFEDKNILLVRYARHCLSKYRVKD